MMLGVAVALVIFAVAVVFMVQFKRCPSDRILVVYGKIGGTATVTSRGFSAKCYHGGGAFIVPIIQDYQYLDLTPIPIEIKLEGALSQQNIRVNTPSTFTIGISTEPGVMENAAERLLGLNLNEIRDLAKDIIFGQMRVTIATMPIESINADREKLIENIYNGVEVELKKIGLRLINVNIQDITDESGYIAALGKEAAARAINDAKIKVAEKERDGEIGQAMAQREQRVQVAGAHATAVEGENLAGIKIAQSSAGRREKEAEASRLAVAAEKVKSAQALQEAYAAEENAERQRAERERATQIANIIVPAQIEKQRIETIAEAEAEKIRRIKKGEADGVRFMMEAEGAGLRAILLQKAEGIQALVDAAGGNPQMASLLMITEQMPKLVAEQVKAISNLKIDNITVWEGGRKDGTGKTSTADFISGMVASLPPLHDIAKNAGIDLPTYLGQLSEHQHVRPEGAAIRHEPKTLAAPAPAAPTPPPAPIPEPPPAPAPMPAAAPVPPPATPPPAKPKTRAAPQTISFYCANCNQPLSADADAAGQMARCPKCANSVRIPNRP
jgi:flotillin